MEDKLHGISLCSGVGGLELGLSLAFGEGYRCVGYCERETFASSILVARMEDKTLDQAPVYSDILSFPGALYREKVDILSAGFPCQPFSVAGLRKSINDERYLWDDILRIIDDIQPKALLLENVPGLLSSPGGTCVCGWPNRWGGLHRNRVSQEERERILLSKSGCRDGGSCSSSSEQIICNIRGERLPVEEGNGGVVGGVQMDTYRESSSGFLSLHRSIIETQEKASRDCFDTWIKWKDEESDPRTEPKRPISQASWLVCPACGRKVENSSDVIRAIAGILGSLADLGFDAEWGCYGAWQVGAPHRRDRIFILAWRISHAELHALREFAERGRGAARQALEGDAELGELEQAVADGESGGLGVLRESPGGEGQPGSGAAQLGHAERDGRRQCVAQWRPEERAAAGRTGGGLADAAGEGPQGMRHATPRWVAFPPGSDTPPSSWPETCPQPALRDRTDGTPHRVDELRALGNGVVPRVATMAFIDLLNRACDS